MKYTQAQIFDKIKEMLVELFEIPMDEIKMESRLYDDLGLDSIDAIDLIGEMQSMIQVRLKPEDFKSVRSVSDVVHAVEEVLKTNEAANI